MTRAQPRYGPALRLATGYLQKAPLVPAALGLLSDPESAGNRSYLSAVTVTRTGMILYRRRFQVGFRID